MKDEWERPSASQGQRFVRYIIGGWNTALGAFLLMVSLLAAEPLYTLIAVASIILGIGIILGKRWALWTGMAVTLISVVTFVASGTNYGYSAAIIQGAMFLGLVYSTFVYGSN